MPSNTVGIEPVEVFPGISWMYVEQCCNIKNHPGLAPYIGMHNFMYGDIIWSVDINKVFILSTKTMAVQSGVASVDMLSFSTPLQIGDIRESVMLNETRETYKIFRFDRLVWLPRIEDYIKNLAKLKAVGNKLRIKNISSVEQWLSLYMSIAHDSFYNILSGRWEKNDRQT